MSDKRLGRGIKALIRSGDNQKSVSSKVENINKLPIKDIHTNPNQPRKKFDENALMELAESIKKKGVISPITVHKVESGYEIIAGERRWRAAKYSNKRVIPAYIINPKSDAEILEMALIENIQREDLNPLEESEAFAVLNTKFNMSHGEIALAVGKKRTTISNSLRLLKLPVDIKKSLRDNRISAGHARAILQSKTVSEMIKLWKKILNKNLSVRSTEALVKKSKDRNKKNTKGKIQPKSPEIFSIENQLIEMLGTKVKIRTVKNGGIIEVSYFSSEDFERIIDLLNSVS